MNKVRWRSEGGGGVWEVDLSTPMTLEAQARPAPGDPLPLGLSRGTKLTRPKQIDFFQRFMSSPFLLSHSLPRGLSLQRLLSIPLFSQHWFGTVLGEFNVQKFVSSFRKDQSLQHLKPVERINRLLQDKSLYRIGFSSELSLTPEDTLLLSYDPCLHANTEMDTPRKRAVFHHEFPHHNLTLEAVSPALFVDKSGNYWDVPLSMGVDFASIASDSSPSYRLTLQHCSGQPKPFQSDQVSEVPASLLPGTSFKTAFAFKKNVDVWRSNAAKLKMKQPFDAFLSNPHISASGIIGGAITACMGDNSVRSQTADDPEGFQGFRHHAPTVKSALLADMFSTVSFTAQHGNFQRLFLDLTRFHTRLDVPSGLKFVKGVAQLAQDFVNSQQPTVQTIKAICPNATLSLQQQIAGPFSFRVDCGVKVDTKREDLGVKVHDPVFALEYALQVLGSAKAVAWYAPKHREFMMELRFFET